MATKKKRIDAAKQREKRTKIAAIGGVVLLLAVGAYEIPSMLKVMNKKPPANTRYDPGPSLTPGGLPNVATSAGATATPASNGQLVDTDVPPASGAGQLVSFSVFDTKNPFTPQVSNQLTPADSSTTSPTTANKPGADVPGTTTTAEAPPVVSAVPSSPGSPSATTTTTTTTTTPALPTVSLSVNGVVSHVASGGTFPSGAPVFRLASWTKGSAQIAIVGGSYAAGTGTLTLHVGEPVTLENQTDGKRYKLELLSTS
jgi:hypothetical protein